MIKFIAHAITHFQRCSVYHSLSLSVSPLSCSLPTTFGSVFNTVMHYHLDHSINVFCEELFSFQRLHLYKSCNFSNNMLHCLYLKSNLSPQLLITLLASNGLKSFYFHCYRSWQRQPGLKLFSFHYCNLLQYKIECLPLTSNVSLDLLRTQSHRHASKTSVPNVKKLYSFQNFNSLHNKLECLPLKLNLCLNLLCR